MVYTRGITRKRIEIYESMISSKEMLLDILSFNMYTLLSAVYFSRECWNWQTGTFEGRVSNGVRVQVPSLAPKTKKRPAILAGFYVLKQNIIRCY